MVRMDVEEEKKPTEETVNGALEDENAEAESPKEVEAETDLSDMTKDQLIEKVEEIQATADQNLDKYMRSQAEMENMKKRFQKDKQDLVKFGNETLLKQLLPVADNMEKALDHSDDKNALKALREGVELTLKGFLSVLEKSGVAPVEALGNAFDPNFHEAILEQEDPDAEPGTVISEFQKGYTLNQRLLRPAMVVVSKKGN